MANIGILFSKDKALRMMTLSTLCTTSCNGVHRTMQSYQIGTLGWGPSNQTCAPSILKAV